MTNGSFFSFFLQCNNCAQLVIHPEQRFNFFSDYSQMVSCPACGVQDAHFCKNINVYLRGQEAEQVLKQALNEAELEIWFYPFFKTITVGFSKESFLFLRHALAWLPLMSLAW